ncbi:MAG: hypothetical protein JNL59_04350 [Chitinophagaceae bacterium]|jgi:hypothetical protein|nr:hypothetical protein [Chitinophagaceae bacterium]
MKKIFAALLGLSVTVLAHAQNGGFKNGDKLLNLGIGVNSYYDKGIPFGASFEAGITDAISVGGNVDYLSSKYASDFKFTALYIAARGSYHFNELLKITNEKVDVYAGVTLGYRAFSWKNDYNNGGLGNSYGSGVFLGGYAGARYYFGTGIGAFAELGAIGSTNARLGVAFRF